MKQEIEHADAYELASAYGTGSLSPLETIADVFTRIEKFNPQINAFCHLDQELSKEQATASEERWAKGEPLSPIDGVPVTIKDLLWTTDWPVTLGSNMLHNGPAPEDAPAVARLKEAGAVLVGMTTTPELGWKGVTDSARHGVTRNPWNLERTTGGSSGGAAAAATLNLGCLHIGTDGGGSIRMPASFSGIFGIKPSFGRVPAYPASVFGTVAHVGPMTRSVRDAIAMLNVLSGPDKRDWFSLPEQSPIKNADMSKTKPLSGMRIAYSGDLGYMSVHPDVDKSVRAAVKQVENLGAVVEEVTPPFDDPKIIFETLWFNAARHRLHRLDAGSRQQIDPSLLEAIEGVSHVTLNDYLDATHQRTELGIQMERFFGKWDALLTPTTPITAFKAGQETPSGDGRWTDWAGFNFPFNLTQQPSCSIPCGFCSEGLPIGLQITTRKHADEDALKIATAFEVIAPNEFPSHPNLIEQAGREPHQCKGK